MQEVPPKGSIEDLINDLFSPIYVTRVLAVEQLRKGLFSQATFPLVCTLLKEDNPQLRSEIIETLLLIIEGRVLEKVLDFPLQLKIDFQKLIENSKEQEEQENLDIVYKALWPKG